jgi:hypothetical protein
MLSELDLYAGMRFATYGRYAQVLPGKVFDGAQFYGLLGDIITSKASACMRISGVPLLTYRKSWRRQSCLTPSKA